MHIYNWCYKHKKYGCDCIATRCVAPTSRLDSASDTQGHVAGKLHILDNDHWYILYDDPHGPQPDPAKIEMATERIKELEGIDVELGPTEKDAELQDKLNRAMRELMRKGLRKAVK